MYVRIDNVEEHKDAVETMMKSLEFADDIAEAKTEAMDSQARRYRDQALSDCERNGKHGRSANKRRYPSAS